MTAWEYMSISVGLMKNTIVHVDGTLEDRTMQLGVILNALGSEGFEMCGVIPDYFGVPTVFLKRPVPQ
jgi:hypothetical protein